MKYYDKEIYKISNKIEIYAVIFCIFLIGFILGYCAIDTEIKEKETNTIMNYIVSGNYK